MSRAIRANAGKRFPRSISVTLSVSSLTVEQSETGTLLVGIARHNYREDVTPVLSNLPSGVTATITPTIVTSAFVQASIQFTVAAGASLVVQTVLLTLNAPGLSPTTVEIPFEVIAAAITPAVVVTPDNTAISIQQGANTTVTYAISRIGGYTGDVTLAITTLPTLVSVSYPDGQVFAGSDATKRVVYAAGGSAPAVSGATPTATASGVGISNYVNQGLTVDVTLPPVPTIPLPDYSDDFTSYADNAAFLANVGTLASGKKYSGIGGPGIGATSLTSAVLFEGHQVVRGRIWDASTSKPYINANIPPMSSFWWQWVQRWDPGFSLNVNPSTYAKAHKMSNGSFGGLPSGKYGRILHAWTNGRGTGPGNTMVPGAASGNNADWQCEGMGYTGADTFVSPTMMSATTDGYNMFHDGEWYEFLTFFNYVGPGEYELHNFVQKYGDPPVRRSSIRIRDKNGSPANVSNFQIMDTFNVFDGGARFPDPGVDQSTYIGKWGVWNNATKPDPFGTGLVLGVDVDFTAVLSDDTIDLVRGGASVPVTLTFVRGAGLPTKNLEVRSIINPVANVTTTYSLAVVPPATGSITVTFSAGASAVPGTYTRYINVVHAGLGGQGAATRSIPVTFNIT